MISVVVPTLNCVREMDSHLESLSALTGLVKEFIFVDSSSEDGTAEKIAEFLRTGVSGVLISCPPGLYAAWNKGVAVAKSRWLTFATVGDTQSANGLQHLMEVAENFIADLVISPPLMMGGRKSLEGSWPLHHLALTKQSPYLMTQEDCIRWLCGFLPGTVLGSAASNLYRRDFLLEHPFPANFGHEGDVAWGLQVAKIVRMVITPHSCAEFQIHERGYTMTARQQADRFNQLVELAQTVIQNHPSLAAEFELLWQRQKKLWQWITSLEDVAETNREQKAYIVYLEEELARSQEFSAQLEKLPLFPPLTFLKRGILSPILKRLFIKPANMPGKKNDSE